MSSAWYQRQREIWGTDGCRRVPNDCQPCPQPPMPCVPHRIPCGAGQKPECSPMRPQLVQNLFVNTQATAAQIRCGAVPSTKTGHQVLQEVQAERLEGGHSVGMMPRRDIPRGALPRTAPIPDSRGHSTGADVTPAEAEFMRQVLRQHGYSAGAQLTAHQALAIEDVLRRHGYSLGQCMACAGHSVGANPHNPLYSVPPARTPQQNQQTEQQRARARAYDRAVASGR